MKGQMTFLVRILVLVAMIAILLSVLSTFKLNRQVALANAQALALAIDEVCLTGEPKELNFTFPQAEPPTALGLAPGLIPGLYVRSFGDPYYLLYYEHFPPGEGLGWEPLAGLGPRAVWPVTERAFIGDVTTLRAAIESLESAAGIGMPVIVPNVILGENNITGDIGTWQDSFYRFREGVTRISRIEKAAIKYRSCGADSLCLKSTEGVLRLPLPTCKAQGIGHVGLENQYVPFDLFERPDFYLASPCEATFLIERATCDCDDIDSTIFGPLYADEKAGSTSWPIYSAEEGTLKSLKKHKSCTHRVKGFREGQLPVEAASFECILVSVQDWSGFCVTQEKRPAFLGALIDSGLIGPGATAAGVTKSIAKAAATSQSKLALVQQFLPGILRAVKPELRGATISAAKAVAEAELRTASRLTKAARLARFATLRLLVAGAILIALQVLTGVTADQPILENTDYIPSVGAFVMDDTNVTTGLGDIDTSVWLWP